MKTLIVEDSTTLCAIYSQYLDGSGLEVTSVESLAAARDALVEQEVMKTLGAISVESTKALHNDACPDSAEFFAWSECTVGHDPMEPRKP